MFMEKYLSKYNSLIDKGYDGDIIYNLFYVSDDVISVIVDKLYNKSISKAVVSKCSRCVIVGGQPGSGKSYYCNKYIKDNSNYVYVSLDNYRVFHPFYNDIRNLVLDKWGDDNGDDEDNPSSDLTSFTHYFAVRVNDMLVDRLMKCGYDILLEWNLRYAEGPLEMINQFKRYNYLVDIVVIVTSRYVSFEACRLRYDMMKNIDRLARRVSFSFHNICVDGLISSVPVICKEGLFDKKLINNIVCMLRDGTIIWDGNSNFNVSSILDSHLNSKSNDINDISYIEKIYNDENNI